MKKYILILLTLILHSNFLDAQKTTANNSITCVICDGDGKCSECGGLKKCKYCQGDKLFQKQTKICPNCANWSQSYRNKVPCHRCKDSRNIIINTCSFCNNKGLCSKCKGNGKCYVCKSKGSILLSDALGTKNTFSANSIIGNSTILNGLEIAQYDFPNVMTMTEALAACKSLGQGWRLPTLDELNFLYNNKATIGGFYISGGDRAYWSMPTSKEVSMTKNFWGGYEGRVYYWFTNLVRAVRTVN